MPSCQSLPGIWEIQGDDIEPDVKWASGPDVERMIQVLHDTDPEARPAVFHLGSQVIRYLPPTTVRPKRSRRGPLGRFWTLLVGILVKLKMVLVFGSMLLSLLVYGFAFGWAFGAGLVGLIAIHESGHVVANRRKGIRASLPLFIPFLGAFIQLKEYPRDAADEAFIGIMGPLFGLGATLVAVLIGVWGRIPVFLAIAEMGFLLHVFNLMPVLPLDGGRTVGFWRWKAWIPGIFGVLVVLFYNPVTNQFTIDPITVFIVALIVVSLVREPRRHGRDYAVIDARSRWTYTVVWMAALLVSLAGYWEIGQLHPFIS